MIEGYAVDEAATSALRWQMRDKRNWAEAPVYSWGLAATEGTVFTDRGAPGAEQAAFRAGACSRRCGTAGANRDGGAGWGPVPGVCMAPLER